MPEGWEWKRLGEAANINMGQSPSGTSYNENGNGTPFLQGNAEFGDIFPKHKKFTTEPSKIASKGSVLISVRAPVGDTNIADLNYCIGRGLASISLKNGDNKYLFYLLRSLQQKIEDKGTGSTFKAISKSILNNIEIPLPPLPIQRQIVAVLEQGEAVSRQRHESDALTGALLQSVFYEMFGDPVRNDKGWEVVEFGDVIRETKNGLYKTDKFQRKGIPILRMYNIYKNRIVLEKYHLITVTADEFEQYQVKPGDILFNRVNSPIWLGKSAVIPEDIGKFVFESKNIRIRVDTSKADPEYIVWYLSTPAGREEISKRAKAAVNQSTVNNTDLREFRILLPPLALQQQFARIVKDVERIREQQVASGRQIEELCEGLVQRAFAGELAT